MSQNDPWAAFQAVPVTDAAQAASSATADPWAGFEAVPVTDTPAPAPDAASSATAIPHVLTVTHPAGAAADKKPVSWLDIAGDLTQSAATGIEKGAIGLAGLPADLGSLGDRLMNKSVNAARAAMGKEPVPSNAGDAGDPARYIGALPLMNGVEALAGPFYKPQTTAGQYAETVGSFVPGAGRTLATAVGRAVLPGILSEGAGQMTEGTAAEPYARFAGALAASPITMLTRRAITPLPADPARLAMVDTLRKEGVSNLTAGQVTGSKKLQAVEGALSEVPFGSGRLADMTTNQGRQFTRAAMRRMGSDADTAAPAALAPAKDALGDQFDRLSARNTITVDPQLGNDLYGATRRYLSNSLGVVPADKSDQLLNLAATVTRAPGGKLSGPVYQNTRSALSKLADAHAVNDPPFAQALRESRDALDDAMSRSVSPEDAEAWNTARRQWGNSKVIEKAASGAGEAAAAGTISPGALRNAAVSGRRGAYATGSGDLDALARAGSGVMTAFPNSGTAARAATMAAASGVGGAIGALSGGVGGAATLASVGALAGPAALSHAIMSRPAQAYLRNQALARPAPVTTADILGILATRANGANVSTSRR